MLDYYIYLRNQFGIFRKIIDVSLIDGCIIISAVFLFICV